MRYLPVELDLRDRDALVIDATAETRAKVERLLEAGARVTVVAEGAVDDDLDALARRGALSLLRRPLEDGDLAGKAIVYAAPGDAEREARLAAWARAEGRLVCVLDRPESSTFVNPSIVDAGGLTIAFGAAGVSPGMLRRLREDFAALFGDERFARFVGALAALRDSLPRSERAERMRAAVRGFAVEARLVFPAWFERGEDAPSDGDAT